ncbi:MAG: helix-turn-helix domain-containing protein [Proteobacteria bacterium]|nr:helix-turn-helix domain-containing protein [Pseudomonadota bacterium]
MINSFCSGLIMVRPPDDDTAKLDVQLTNIRSIIDSPMSRLRPQDAETRAQRANGADFSEALARGLRVIAAFDEQQRRMTLSDIARVIDLPRATTRRALTTLVELGYVENEGRLFRLTPRILKLAIAYLSSDPVPGVLQPACERISREVGASCSVAVRDGDECVMIARGTAARPASVGLSIGFRLPLFCSALGRVLAGAMPDPELDAFLARLKPVRFTRQTVISKPEIRRQILDVRRKGYALVDQEAEAGIRSLAVPVVRFDGKVVASLNIGVQPDQVPSKTMIAEYAPLLMKEAAALRERLV